MKLKLEIEFDSEEQMARVTEAIAASNRVQSPPHVVTMEANVTVDHSAPAVFNDEDVQEEPTSVHMGNETNVENTPEVRNAADNTGDTQVAPTVKRRRKTKADVLAKTGSVLDNAGEVLTDEERKAHAKEIAAIQAKPTVEEALTQTPRNFYSLTDFLNNFATILNQLVKDATLSHRSLQEYCEHFKVPFIYALSKDKKKLEEFYNTLVQQGHITKKGDY